MLSTTTSFQSSHPQMTETTANSTTPISSFQIKTSFEDGPKPGGAATAADQQAAAAAAPLKCPRCDSANTKFCYYNNYSLSQPRHFCKACKRYWTRGGTLRNVPVGGGCRKTKQRFRQQATKPPAGHRTSNSHENGPDQTARVQGQMEDPNLRMEFFNGFGSSRVTDLNPGTRVSSSSEYGQVHNLGLGFSPKDYMRNNQCIDSSYHSSYPTLFGSNFSSPSAISSASPLTRSVLGSAFEYEKFVSEPSSLDKWHMGNFLSFSPLEENPHIGGGRPGFGPGIKIEELGQMKFSHMGSLSSPSTDPSFYNWSNGASGQNSWSDVPNIGSSVMSLL